MSHKAVFGGLSAVLFGLAFYCLVGGEIGEATWNERLRAAGGFGLFALFFLWGCLRERKLEAKEQESASPDQAEKE